MCGHNLPTQREANHYSGEAGRKHTHNFDRDETE
jgi:hypothetical protein